MQSAERVSQHDASDNYVFQRSILAYHKAAELVSGDVLEIGTGMGYGIGVVAPSAEHFTTIDKSQPDPALYEGIGNVEFRQITVPPLTGIASESCDYVISFQVIEHIKDDACLIREVHRVLRPGGKFIVSTPNRLMSLTRNPWHIREYTPKEFSTLLGHSFPSVEALGVCGNDKVMEYYENNRLSVRRIMKYDILRLQYNLPRWMLRWPYDVMNRRNRRKLLSTNTSITVSIRMDDYFFAPADERCFDLFYIAEK